MINDRLANCNEVDEEEIIPLRRKLSANKTDKKSRMKDIIKKEINLRSFQKKRGKKSDVNHLSQALYIGDHPQFKGNKK